MRSTRLSPGSPAGSANMGSPSRRLVSASNDFAATASHPAAGRMRAAPGQHSRSGLYAGLLARWPEPSGSRPTGELRPQPLQVLADHFRAATAFASVSPGGVSPRHEVRRLVSGRNWLLSGFDIVDLKDAGLCVERADDLHVLAANFSGVCWSLMTYILFSAPSRASLASGRADLASLFRDELLIWLLPDFTQSRMHLSFAVAPMEAWLAAHMMPLTTPVDGNEKCDRELEPRAQYDGPPQIWQTFATLLRRIRRAYDAKHH